MTTTDKLAAALRGLLYAPGPCDCGPQGCGETECRRDQCEAAEQAARNALAELMEADDEYDKAMAVEGRPGMPALPEVAARRAAARDRRAAALARGKGESK